jgi:hypothetical protein
LLQLLLLPHLLFRPLLHLHELSQNQTQSDLRINVELDRAVSAEWMVVSLVIGVIVVVVIVVSTIMMTGGVIVFVIVGVVNDVLVMECSSSIDHTLSKRYRPAVSSENVNSKPVIELIRASDDRRESDELGVDSSSSRRN